MIIQSNIDDLQMKRRKNGAYAPILLRTKTRRFALRFAPPYHFPLPVGYGPSWITCIEHDEDEVGLVDDFVQHADVVSPLLFLRLVGSCRHRVRRGKREVVSRCGLCELG
jgi:hypothetical protein